MWEAQAKQEDSTHRQIQGAPAYISTRDSETDSSDEQKGKKQYKTSKLTGP